MSISSMIRPLQVELCVLLGSRLPKWRNPLPNFGSANQKQWQPVEETIAKLTKGFVFGKAPFIL